jgi:RES domain-containing protein
MTARESSASDGGGEAEERENGADRDDAETAQTRVDASYAGLAFRQCHPDHTSVAETLRVGAAFPSRFTPPGGHFGALYIALTPETATAELRRRAGQLGVPLAALAPRAMLTLAVRLRRVLDLTDAAVRAAWGLTEADLASDDYARCQEVALAARADGYEAIRYASAAVRGSGAVHEPAVNLAIFADRLHPGSEVRVVRSEPLPLDDA